jgi:hypothetical protein
MNMLRLTSSLVFLAAAAAPALALAGNFDVARVPLKGLLVQADACAHQRALDILDRNQMAMVAEVPRTDALYRFVVDWKSDLFAVTVGTNDCRIDVVNYAKAIKPYCDYVPGLRTSCRMDEVLAQ